MNSAKPDQIPDEEVAAQIETATSLTETKGKPKIKRLVPSRAQKTRSQLDTPTPDESGFTPWQIVIWREWCRSKDNDYAYYLFALVGNTAFGRTFVLISALLGLLLGALTGYWLGSLISANANLTVASWNLAAVPPLLLTWTLAMAGSLIGIEGSRRFRSWYFWWQGQPPFSRVEWALQQAVASNVEAKTIWEEALQRLAEQKKEAANLTELITALQNTSWIERFVARQGLITLGGEATTLLSEFTTDNKHPLWETAFWLLSSIEQKTKHDFAWRTGHTQCPYCQTRFKANSVEVSLGISFTCYGCRTCNQSRHYLYLPQGVVAVLDNNWTDEEALPDASLRINWLTRRTLFDFDWVELVAANDEDVERFAVQIGNDTDIFRHPRYQQMRCIIGPACHLSANTLRILDRTFGSVEHYQE